MIWFPLERRGDPASPPDGTTGRSQRQFLALSKQDRREPVPDRGVCSRVTLLEAGMLYWVVVLLVLAVIAGILGFGGIAFAAVGLAKILFVVFLILLVISLIFGALRRR
jgi:uncharacterized membrane protein YtjA (UPF0391 family)